jgi:hypothetical protein
MMFDDDEEAVGAAGKEEIQEWRHKLVLATAHLRRTQELKKAMAAQLNGQAKHYRKLTEALADAVRFGSPLELENALGPKWEDLVADIKPLDGYNESLAHWMTARMEEDE